MTYVAAFRAYDWSPDIEALAHRFFAACPGARHVVLADETRGPLPNQPFEKVSHTDDTSRFGLPNHPQGRSLWYNVDYGLYFLAEALPGYDYYVVSESDLAVNLPLTDMVETARRESIDFIARDCRPADPEWIAQFGGAEVFVSPWRSLLFFMVLSARAIALLLAARQMLARRRLEGQVAIWPFCEMFVPSVLVKMQGVTMADVARFADVENLNYRPRVSINDPRSSAPGSLVHSVLGSDKFIAETIEDLGATTYLQPGTKLHQELRYEPPERVIAQVRAEFIKTGDRVSLAALDQAHPERSAPPMSSSDIALGKPALSSSVSAWSRHPDPARDAGVANGATLPDDFAFHTDLEDRPWWIVDLTEEYVVDAVEIVNRAAIPDKFRQFTIESSRDGQGWHTRLTKWTLEPVSADPAQPWRLDLSDPFVARFVRIRLLGRDTLHLRRVRIFGRAIGG